MRGNLECESEALSKSCNKERLAMRQGMEM